MIEQCKEKTLLEPEAIEQQPQEKKPQNDEESHQLKTQMVIQFNGGELNLKKRKYCLKMNLLFKPKPQNEAQATSIHDLFPQKAVEQTLNVTISSLMMSEELRQQFPTINDLFSFIASQMGSEEKVSINKGGMTLKKEEGKTVYIDFQELQDLEAARNKVNIDIENIEDKLLQFNSKQWKILENAADFYLNGKDLSEAPTEIPQNGDSNKNSALQEEQLSIDLIKQYAHYVSGLDQDDFLQEQCLIEEEEDNEPHFMETIEAEEKAIKEFQEQYSDVLKKYRHSHQIHHSSGDHSRKNITPKVTPKSVAPYPPGYTPPHLVGQTSSEAGTEDPKLMALNSKKEKLRIGKKMLKMGYTLQEVIQHIEKMERQQKSGKDNAFVAPTQGPIRPFHIARPRSTENARIPSKYDTTQSSDKEVRQMLIQLLKEKRYKKLEQVKSHMQREGLVTTMQTLKGMVDEIRAKNAQRKKQKQSE